MARFDAATAQTIDFGSTSNPDLLFELGLVYATGRDGQEDMVAAHKWFNIAAYKGSALAKARREEIAADMTKEQIAKAQRAAREWITQH